MTWAIVLAAGASTRMGRPKALLRLADGRFFFRAIADCALAGGVDGLVLVSGPPHHAEVTAALADENVQLHHKIVHAHNSTPERGMLSSVQAGIAALPATATAALVWPVDTPYVRAATVRSLVGAAPERIVVPAHAGRGGHPLRLPRSLFAELAALDAAGGLRALLQAHPDRVDRLEVDDPGVLVDVDTPEDYAKSPPRG